ncbi:hypothetical protein Mapa_001017 [Marchantia paleacea]|nr:hypothetical protein Mapa_001017 [Marchantia paleacea]
MSLNEKREVNNNCCILTATHSTFTVSGECEPCEGTVVVTPRKFSRSRSRLQNFRDSQDSNNCHSGSPHSNHSTVVFPVDEEPESAREDQISKQQRMFNISAKSLGYYALVFITSVGLAISFITASLLGRFYFDRGGQSLWLYTLSQSVGFPVTGLIMILIRLHRKLNYSLSLYAMSAYVFLGIIVAIDNLFYSFSVLYLPISTVGLLGATHVAFTSIFAYILVKKKLTAFSVNTVILVTLSAVLLELASKTNNESVGGKYALGFAMSMLANLLYGLLLPLMELILQKLDHARRRKEARKISSGELDLQNDDHERKASDDKYLEVYIMLEMHTYSTAVASLVVFIGMMASGDYARLKAEMGAFRGGMEVYWISFVGGAVGWQLTTLSTLGIIMLTSSLFAGVLTSFNLPFLALSAVFFFGDKFGGLKAIAMILSLWGFTSYLYGGYLDSLPGGQE